MSVGKRVRVRDSPFFVQLLYVIYIVVVCGYCSNQPQNANGGGLLVYVREKAPVKELKEYSFPLGIESSIECSIIEINLKADLHGTMFVTIVIKIRDDFPHEIHDDFVSDLH